MSVRRDGQLPGEAEQEKQTEVHTGKIPFAREVTVVECAMQGWRKTMEDQSLLEFKLDEIEELDGKCCIFGVFDGHGGQRSPVAKTTSRKVHRAGHGVEGRG